MLVRDLDVEETVERVNIAQQEIQLSVALQGLGSTSRGRMVGKDWESAIWLADSLAKGRVQWRKNLTDMITAEHQENWARGLSHDKYQELLDCLTDIGFGGKLDREGWEDRSVWG